MQSFFLIPDKAFRQNSSLQQIENYKVVPLATAPIFTVFPFIVHNSILVSNIHGLFSILYIKTAQFFYVPREV